MTSETRRPDRFSGLPTNPGKKEMPVLACIIMVSLGTRGRYEGGDMKKRRSATFGALIVLLASVLVSPGVSAAEPLRITKEELKQQLGKPDIVIVDVRSGGGWKGSERKIAGAVREEPNDVGGWEKRYAKDKHIVLYCD